jgi:uncharacterized protein (DUF58 family)
MSRFRDRLRRWLRPPRTLKTTREGKYFIGITIGVGFAAINTGNNLLYLLLGMMLSLIIASGILSEMSLRSLEVTRRPPARVHARTPLLIGIGLKNKKRRFPSFSVEVEDLIDDRPLDKKCYFLKLPAGRQQDTSYRHSFPRRGRYVFTAFRISTKFPFALFRKSRRVEVASEVIVYPQLVPVARTEPPRAHASGDQARGRFGRRGEFASLREWREGDDPRDIHWRSTARKGRSMVREYEDESARRVSLFLDNALPGGAACQDEALRESLERSISLAASLSTDYLERGYTVRVVVRGDRDTPAPWLDAPAQLPQLYRQLALLRPATPETPFCAPAGAGTPLTISRGAIALRPAGAA